MEIHFYESLKVVPNNCDIILDWQHIHDIWESMHNECDNWNMQDIHTIQMCMLSNTWILKGYRMFVHQDNGIIYEIVLRDKNNHGDNAVRIAQNVYAMWASKVFRDFKER